MTDRVRSLHAADHVSLPHAANHVRSQEDYADQLSEEERIEVTCVHTHKFVCTHRD